MHGTALARVVAAPSNPGTLTSFYDTACRALAEARRVDEVKGIRDKAAAVREYARQAKNTKLVEDATAVILRAERCCGQKLREMAERDERPRGRKKESHVATLSELGINRTQSSRWQKLAAIPADKFEAKLASESKLACNRVGSRLLRGSQSVECYTPAKYVNAARRVLGTIDLDPASCELANRTVRATRYFTKEQDGLAQTWHGRVFMNSPYLGGAGPFVTKLVAEYRAGNVTAAIALVSGRDFDARWFQSLFDYVLCFTDHRIRFYGDKSNPETGSVFAYLGPDPDAFEREFAQFGNVMVRYRRRAA
jgi:hypothetical protein